MTEQSADQGHHADDKPETAASLVPDMPGTVSEAATAPTESHDTEAHDTMSHDAAKPADTPAPHETVSKITETSPQTAPKASNVMILWPDRGERSDTFSSHQDDASDRKTGGRASPLRRKRLAALGAVAAVAAVCGAVGGALATAALGSMFAPPAARQETAATVDTTGPLREAIARVTADVGGLRNDFDRAGKLRVAQIGKLDDRLGKVEKSQDDVANKVTKINDAQEKAEKAQDRLRSVSAAAAPETTGSIASPVAKANTNTDPAFKKPAVVDGWNLTRVTGGGAIVDGPDGLFEAYPGDPLPGLGRVDAVRYQDGRWVVVTPKGLIVHR